MKRILSWLCTVVMVMQMIVVLPGSVYAADTNTASVVVSTATAKAGDTGVEVTVDLSNNPGICGMILTIEYDKTLTLVDVKQGTALSTLTLAEFAKPYLNPIRASWDGITAEDTNGTILKMYFDVDSEAEAGTYNITATYEFGDVFDNDMNDLYLDITSGAIVVSGDETHSHSMTYTAAKEANCHEEGNVEYWYCSGCEKYFADEAGTTELDNVTTDKDADNHAGGTEIKDAVEATCGENGYTGDTYCLDCGEKIADGKVIPATGDHTGGVATCKDKAVCEVCGQPYGELDSDNHKGETEVRDAKEATCAEDGYTGDTYCLDCGEKIADGTVIPATGKHTDEDGDKLCDVCGADLSCKHTGKTEVKGAVEATCVKDGYSGDTYCKDCGEKIADGTVIPATGKHIAGKWIIDKEATEDETGLRHKECVVCGKLLETEEIPVVEEKNDFDFNKWYFNMAQLTNQKFTVTAEVGEGGFISNEGKTFVKYNNSITYYITPADGYEIEAVYVNGRNVGAVGQYTFKNVKSNQSIYATFVNTAWANPFIDIFESDSYYEAIEFVYENGLFKGVSSKEFAPETTMTRAMFVTVLGRLAGVDADDYTDTAFDDVVFGEWYAPYVEWAASEGIVNGYGDGMFGVNDEITVEQAVVIMARYAEYVGIDTDSDVSLERYSDADEVSDWAIGQMKWAIEEGIYNGVNGKLNPSAPANRALIAEILYAFVTEFGE